MQRSWVVGAALLLISGCASSAVASNATRPRDAAKDLMTRAASSAAAASSVLPTPFEPPASPMIAPDSSSASGLAPQCPLENQPRQTTPTSGALVGIPTSVRLCGFAGSGPMNGRPIGGVVLGAGPATALIAALSNAPSASPAVATCNDLPTVLMQFSFAEGPPVDVPVVTYGCEQNLAFVADATRVIDTDLSDTIVADAGSYLLTGAPTPDLYGQSVSQAEATATRWGNGVDFGGQLVDPDASAGTVVLQDPPAGAGPSGPGSTIDVILAAPVAPSCRTAQLAIDYYGGGLAGGGDFGSIRLRNITAKPCALTGSVRLVGTNEAGQPVTQTLTYPTQQPLVLTANAPRVPVGQAPPLGETTALLILGATYTNAAGACVGDEVTPAVWRVSLPDGTLTVPNTSNDPEGNGFASLLTCGGHLDTAIPIREG
jgi:hypothetical protein